MSEQKYGTVILFGAKPPYKADPRFPVPITLAGGTEEIDYVSRSEAQEMAERAREEVLSGEGPRGADRRWKLAAEMAFGQTFDTPRQLIDRIRSSKPSPQAAGEEKGGRR